MTLSVVTDVSEFDFDIPNSACFDGIEYVPKPGEHRNGKPVFESNTAVLEGISPLIVWSQVLSRWELVRSATEREHLAFCHDSEWWNAGTTWSVYCPTTTYT